MNLAYETFGDPANPSIMALHGFMSCNDQWLRNRGALSESHFLVTVELWGHGDSPTPDDTEAYTIDTYIAQFESIRTELKIEQWALIGQSYGAGLVVNYAVRCPAQCTAVIVTNSRSAFGSLDSGQQPARRPGQQSQRTSSEPDPDMRKLPYHPIHARRFPEEVKQALVRKADAMTPTAIRLGGNLGGQLHSFDLLAQLSQPVLLTNGVYEKAFQGNAKKLRERYPHLQIAELQGGHSVNIEAAAAFNDAVLKFLQL